MEYFISSAHSGEWWDSVKCDGSPSASVRWSCWRRGDKRAPGNDRATDYIKKCIYDPVSVMGRKAAEVIEIDRNKDTTSSDRRAAFYYS